MKRLRRPLQRLVQLPLKSEVQHGDPFDCSVGSVLARWRWVGILPLARLTRLPDERVTPLLDPIWGIYEGSTVGDTARTLFTGFFRFPELSQLT